MKQTTRKFHAARIVYYDYFPSSCKSSSSFLTRGVGVFAHTQNNYKPQHGVSDYLGAGIQIKSTARSESAARARRERNEREREPLPCKFARQIYAPQPLIHTTD